MKLEPFITILLSSLLLVACGGNEKDPEKEIVNAPVVDEEEVTAPEEKKDEGIQPELNKQASEEEYNFDLFGDDPIPEKGGVINVDQIKAIMD